MSLKENPTPIDMIKAIKELEEATANGGTAVSVAGTPVATLGFTSDPQTQLDDLNSNKADKVSDATADNLASLDADGNLQDSGISKDSVVTTDTDQNIGGQKVFDDIHATNTITFHNNNADYNAIYKGFIYQYKDQIDISRSKEADGSDFSGVFSLDLSSKKLYIDGQKMATVGETQIQASTLRTNANQSVTLPSTQHTNVRIPLQNVYGTSSSKFAVTDGMFEYKGSATRGLISFQAVIQFNSGLTYRDTQVNILRHNTDGTTTGIVTARHAIDSAFTTFTAPPHYIQLASGQKYELRIASGVTNQKITAVGWQTYITIQELY